MIDNAMVIMVRLVTRGPVFNPRFPKALKANAELLLKLIDTEASDTIPHISSQVMVSHCNNVQVRINFSISIFSMINLKNFSLLTFLVSD